ncbi:DNA binding protein [Pseudomonas sp. MH9.2]|uniref:histone-like nucleoid-structuring protein, MvaT/MvaU family n=1 Tax=unclassified Pseudomonas TaxID=196821 RepID=UPI002AC95989|nr:MULTISPECIES: histone-like nucleoid-structuring protein, MvaT/MvaU family [unclassified Pseudomonas]MEB0029056.1 DNA binding protein [Pseudomonas sp. MH9.2]MEB0150575.1 DNA binding protein [Pseudomonas sp. CCC2.2]MEE3509596.1 DNA binding protein [Pseudomonas sp. 10C3]WPX68884.1 histone-like nucleoid-structuring protein, MvaT/MvaU family [Pseudomonas sp. MH9.2]
MSRLAEFRALEQQLARQIQDLEILKNDPVLQKSIEFESKLKKLMSQYNQDLRSVIVILDPNVSLRASADGGSEKKQRKARVLKRYKNPESGEVIETKGGNHKILKQWQQTYGTEAVEGWAQE